MTASNGSTELVPHGLARLQRAPIVDQIDAQTMALIASQIAPTCTKGEIGHFLELCAHYDLDPFAKEAWCAKGKSGKLLIMVGRDGLRKIAQRQGLHVDGDVVRADDAYEVEFIDADADARPGEWEANGGAPFHRVTHRRTGMGQQRGAIVGAWCRVKDHAGREGGWFEAPLEEYKPQSTNDYSPWQRQVGVMILAAAERQAIRQATPLGGLLAIGEDEVVFDAQTVGYEIEQPPEDERLTGEEITQLCAIVEQSDWSEDETRMQLAAAGAQDTTNVPTALGTMTREQATAFIAKLTGQEASDG